jgi:cytochrome c oxidase subunit IV
MSEEKTLIELASARAQQQAAVVPAAMVEAAASAHDAHEDDDAPHIAPDYTILLGRRINANVYVVVFGILGALTLFEVLMAEILPYEFFLRTPLLVVASIIKAIMVMWFYMHLKDDSKIFAAAIILPLIVGMVSSMFLLAVPSTGY